MDNRNGQNQEESVVAKPTEDNGYYFHFQLTFGGGGEEPVVVQGTTESTEGLSRGLINLTLGSFPDLFELTVQRAMIAKVTDFLLKRRERLAKIEAETRRCALNPANANDPAISKARKSAAASPEVDMSQPRSAQAGTPFQIVGNKPAESTGDCSEAQEKHSGAGKGDLKEAA